jgi:hypothetical protein
VTPRIYTAALGFLRSARGSANTCEYGMLLITPGKIFKPRSKPKRTDCRWLRSVVDKMLGSIVDAGYSF